MGIESIERIHIVKRRRKIRLGLNLICITIVSKFTRRTLGYLRFLNHYFGHYVPGTAKSTILRHIYIYIDTYVVMLRNIRLL